MRRRMNGDEEIRRLLRELNEEPTADTAERLAKELRRREEPDTRPRFKCPNCADADKPEPESACALEALAVVVSDRLMDDEDLFPDDVDGSAIRGAVMEWLSTQNAFEWWTPLGEVVDDMEADFRSWLTSRNRGRRGPRRRST